MPTDEQQIRDLIQTWMAATRAGDVDRILDLVAEDAVFLVAGREPMRKPEFAAQAHAQARPGGPVIEGTSDIQDVQVAGDWAFLWTKLAVRMTPPDGSPAVARSGYTLTVLRREGGRWRLARDANLLAPAAAPTA